MTYDLRCEECDEDWGFPRWWFSHESDRFLAIMADAQMGYPSDPGPWPDQAGEFEADDDHPDLVKFLTWAGCEERPGIPFHKFESNDAWRIRRDECSAAIAAWKLNGSRAPERFADLLTALHHGATCSGLVVS